MRSSTSRRTQIGAEGSLPSSYKPRRNVPQSDRIGSSKTKQTAEADRTIKDKGKNAHSLPGPSIAKPKDSTRTVKKSVGASFKEIMSSQLTSDTSGKLGDSCCFAMANAVDKKSKALIAAASRLINEKSLQCRMEDLPGHIRAEEESCNDHLLKPVGTRCQLCKLDLAFTAKPRETLRANDRPPVAVLPCGHCYHNSCAEEFFGAVEPPCITCLDC